MWERFQQWHLRYGDLGFSMDISRMRFGDSFFESMSPKIERAFADMAALEGGAVANPDEDRMVGHYWLRAPALAPTTDLRGEIESTLAAVKAFAAAVHSGEVKTPKGAKFTEVLIVGIGGSALGPQFVADSLGTGEDRMKVHFLDNTDPDGIDRVLDGLGPLLATTLVVVISKSGGTKETRNGMLETKACFEAL